MQEKASWKLWSPFQASRSSRLLRSEPVDLAVGDLLDEMQCTTTAEGDVIAIVTRAGEGNTMSVYSEDRRGCQRPHYTRTEFR